MAPAKWRVVVADAPHRDTLYAEIWVQDEHLGEVYFDDNKPIIEIYAHRINQDWKFEYEIFLDIIHKVNEFVVSMKSSN